MHQDQGLRAVVGFVVAAGVLAGCGGGPAHLSDDMAQELLTDLTPVERAGLADKVVTFGEYSAGVDAIRECLVAAGFQVDPASLGPDGLIQYTYGLEGFESSADLDSFEAKGDACSDEGDALEVVYSMQIAPSQEERQAGIDELRRCVDDLGLEFESDAPISDIVRELYDAGFEGRIDPEDGRACIDPFQAVTLEPVPGLEEALKELDL